MKGGLFASPIFPKRSLIPLPSYWIRPSSWPTSAQAWLSSASWSWKDVGSDASMVKCQTFFCTHLALFLQVFGHPFTDHTHKKKPVARTTQWFTKSSSVSSLVVRCKPSLLVRWKPSLFVLPSMKNCKTSWLTTSIFSQEYVTTSHPQYSPAFNLVLRATSSFQRSSFSKNFGIKVIKLDLGDLNLRHISSTLAKYLAILNFINHIWPCLMIG